MSVSARCTIIHYGPYTVGRITSARTFIIFHNISSQPMGTRGTPPLEALTNLPPMPSVLIGP